MSQISHLRETLARRATFKDFILIFTGGLAGYFWKQRESRFKGSLKALLDPNKVSLLYVGHATWLINFYGVSILTDPIFARHVAYIFPRLAKPGIPLSQLPEIDYTIISHAHFDHLNRPTLRQIAKKTKTLILARKLTEIVDDLGFKNIVELDWGRVKDFGDIKISAYRAEHWGTRVPWGNTDYGYNSYLLERKGKAILFGGDTAYSPIFKKIGQMRHIDIAMFPIGAYFPSSFRQFHMDPADAIRTFNEVNADFLLPMHWGVFRLSLEPIDEPPRWIKQLAQENNLKNKVKLLYPGEKFELKK